MAEQEEETVEQRAERLRDEGVILCGPGRYTAADLDAVERFREQLRNRPRPEEESDRRA